MSKNFEEAFRTALRRLGISSEAYQSKAFESVKSVANVEKVDVVKFESWFNSWVNTIDFAKITAIGRYFVKTFKTQLDLGTFSLEETQDPEVASAPQSVSEFEASWEDWKKLLNELDPDDGIPSKGVLCQDDNTNVIRAISDGNGGIVYIDGTLSERYPRFEDLDVEKKRDISNACIKLHRSAGYLERFKGLMEKIKPYETAS